MLEFVVTMGTNAHAPTLLGLLCTCRTSQEFRRKKIVMHTLGNRDPRNLGPTILESMKYKHMLAST